MGWKTNQNEKCRFKAENQDTKLALYIVIKITHIQHDDRSDGEEKEVVCYGI